MAAGDEGCATDVLVEVVAMGIALEEPMLAEVWLAAEFGTTDVWLASEFGATEDCVCSEVEVDDVDVTII